MDKIDGVSPLSRHSIPTKKSQDKNLVQNDVNTSELNEKIENIKEDVFEASKNENYKLESIQTKYPYISVEGVPEKISIDLSRKRINSLMQSISTSPSASEVLKEVNELSQSQLINNDTDAEYITSLHQLYTEVAKKLTLEGKIEEAFSARSRAAEIIAFFPSHPLYHLENAIEHNVQKQASTEFHAHFSGFDTGIVKGSTLSAKVNSWMSPGWPRKKMHENTQIHFSVSSVAKAEIFETIQQIRSNLPLFEQSLPKDLKGGITISDVKTKFGEKIKIQFDGVGEVIIGNDAKWNCYYNDVDVVINKGKESPGEGLKAFHQMLTVLGCGPIACLQRPEDDEKIKIAQLFRAYYPKEAYNLENSKQFFDSTVPELINIIEAKVPEMKNVFQRYLIEHPELMKKEEIYSGQSVWAVGDFGDKIREKGGWGLMAGVSALPNVTKIIKHGSLSSKDRFEIMGSIVSGVSSEEDLCQGGGGHVFTRMLSNKFTDEELNIKDDEDYDNFPFSGRAQILYDLDVLNRGGYAYETDRFGDKRPNVSYYSNRDNLIDFAEKKLNGSNEVMVKNRIGPESIRGVLVQTYADKNQLISDWEEANLIKTENGQKFVLGKPLDEFLTVDAKFTKDKFKKPI